MATFDGLFDPAKVAEKRRLDSEKREALARIKAWAEELLPEPARGRLKVTVNEVVCGDPACAPIDTVVEFWGELRTGFGMPSRAAEVTHADLVSFLPDEDVLLRLWQQYDYNGNGMLSLAEIDKFIIAAQHSKDWSEFHAMDAKPALRRAYRFTAVLNGRQVGAPNAGVDMTFDFPTLIAHCAKSRSLVAGTVTRDDDPSRSSPVQASADGSSSDPSPSSVVVYEM